MNDSLSNRMMEPKKVGVWAEGTHIEAKEYILPEKSPDLSDDIPTIPDVDDLQDILEKEIIVAPVSDRKNMETVNTLAEVGGGITGADGIDAVLEILNKFIPEEELDTADNIWTVDSLLAQLADESPEAAM
ncbi:uncharacterized protein LOC115444699 [Manduca sexta]|uniref:Uncharacterized protein n=1 Tax=Manduca sexta TaxID=7130 RepID=A0A921Z7I0_MANSE|nr:uncharacterized protein LOC115444699 [Manduca sexta]KAG6451959.1 hypothetical protein O3G_MSEX007399 [Manduca sexta]